MLSGLRALFRRAARLRPYRAARVAFTRPLGPRGKRRVSVLIVGIMVLVLWQSAFGAPRAKLDNSYRITASSGVHYDRNFAHFLYYLNLFPVLSTSNSRCASDTQPGCWDTAGTPAEYSYDAAKRVLETRGSTLQQDLGWTWDAGDRGKIYLYLFDAWLKGAPWNPSPIPAARLGFIVALSALFAATWWIRRPLVGFALVLFLGFEPVSALRGPRSRERLRLEHHDGDPPPRCSRPALAALEPPSPALDLRLADRRGPARGDVADGPLGDDPDASRGRHHVRARQRAHAEAARRAHRGASALGLDRREAVGPALRQATRPRSGGDRCARRPPAPDGHPPLPPRVAPDSGAGSATSDRSTATSGTTTRLPPMRSRSSRRKASTSRAATSSRAGTGASTTIRRRSCTRSCRTTSPSTPRSFATRCSPTSRRIRRGTPGCS